MMQLLWWKTAPSVEIWLEATSLVVDMADGDRLWLRVKWMMFDIAEVRKYASAQITCAKISC